MAITRYEPYGVMSQLQREMGRLFGEEVPFRVAGGDRTVGESDWTPAVDIREEVNRYVLTADLPGVDPVDVDITMDKNVLTVRGSRKSQDTAQDAKFLRTERSSGAFFRQFTLPEIVNRDKITAKYTNGIVEIILPKGEGAQPRKITVEV